MIITTHICRDLPDLVVDAQVYLYTELYWGIGSVQHAILTVPYQVTPRMHQLQGPEDSSLVERPQCENCSRLEGICSFLESDPWGGRILRRSEGGCADRLDEL